MSEIINILGYCALGFIVMVILKVSMGIINAWIFCVFVRKIRAKKGRFLKGWFYALPKQALNIWAMYPKYDITTTVNGWQYNSNWWFIHREKKEQD